MWVTEATLASEDEFMPPKIQAAVGRIDRSARLHAAGQLSEAVHQTRLPGIASRRVEPSPRDAVARLVFEEYRRSCGSVSAGWRSATSFASAVTPKPLRGSFQETLTCQAGCDGWPYCR